VGDAVLAEEVVIVSGSGLQKVPFSSPGACRDLVSRQTGDTRRLFTGLFASTATIMPKSRLAALLPPDTPHAVVEMESAAIARVASENGIPFVGLRTVSDPFDEELTFSLDEFCDPQMRISIPRVLFSVARRPRILPQLIRLAHNSRIAADSLSLVMARFLTAV
jgi:adenosylhomocysteine nucleosidase